MTQAIIDEDSKNKKDVYEFLEEDDDFEEFDIAGEVQANNEDAYMIDTNVAVGAGEAEKKLWQEDWDD
jgi:tellurite resistance protein